MERKKFRLLFDKDVEQDWLNDLCRQGWAFKSFFLGVYTFAPCRPGEYIYRVDLLPGSGFRPSDPDGYIEFMEEAGVEVVQRWVRWVILRKRAEDGPFDVYTDTDSQIELYRRIRAMFIWALGLELLCSCNIWINMWRGEPFLYIFAVIFVAIYVVFIRAIWRCTQRIQALERKK